MAVTSFKLKSEGREATIENSAKRTYSRNYVAVTSARTDTELTVRTDPRCPYPLQPYPGDPRALVRSVRVQSVSVNVWEVAVEYGTYVGDPAQIEHEEDPLNDPYVLEYATVHTTRVAQKGLTPTGQTSALINSAYEPFDAADLEVLDSRPSWRITYNSSTFDASHAEEFVNSVNSVAWNGWPVRTAMIYDISARSENRGGRYYFAVTIEVHFNRSTWDLEILDQGHREIAIPITNPARPFTLFRDSEGNPDPIPRLLNGLGGQLAPGGTPVFKRYRVYKEKDFSTLIL